MPLSRSLLQYSCRGFICQSCISKLSLPRRRPWAVSRDITSESQAAKKIRTQVKENTTTDSAIKYWHEREDGSREEIDVQKNAAVVQDLDARIIELEKTLDRVNAGDLSPEEQEIEEEMNQLTPEQRKELLDAIGKAIDPENDPLISHPQYKFVIDYTNLPPLDARQLESLVKLLRRTALGTEFTDLQQKNVWKRYSIARQAMIKLADRVPADIWTFLWTVFAKTAIKNPLRLSRLKTLAENMESAGVTLSDTQVLVYMEAWYLHGQKNNALSRWRSLIGTLGKKESAVFRQFWEMGVRMLAMNGHPQEALDAAAALFKDDPDADPRIVIPIIASWIASQDNKRLQKAWIVYRKLQLALSKTIEMKDYDAIAAIFLAADLPGLALGVFRDMMTAGNQAKVPPKSDVKQIFSTIFSDTVGAHSLEVYPVDQATNVKDVDWSTFEALAYLPSRIRNKFFFGSWIKKLLGEREITGALQVLELMRKYKVRPYAIQLNGVVGALLRSNSASSVAIGEKIAWNMIKARSQFVAAQKRRPVLEGPARSILSSGKNEFVLAVGDLSLTPPATAETLALLIENYRRRGLHSYVKDLWAFLRALNLRPNTFILNQFLLAYHRASDEAGMWKIYHECVETYHVIPDLDTIKWLWMFMKQRQTSPIRPSPGSTNQALARKLFQTTIKYIPLSLTNESDNILMADIYDLVITCFGLLDDQLATALAIRAFYKHLGLYPTERTKQKIITQLSVSDGHMKRLKSPIHHDRIPRKRKQEITNIVQAVERKRTGELREQGIDLEMASREVKGEERMFLLTELLKSLWRVKVEEVARNWEGVDGGRGRFWGVGGGESREEVLIRRHVGEAVEMMGLVEVKPWED